MPKNSRGGRNGGRPEEGGTEVEIKESRDLVSERERKTNEVDAVLTVARDLENKYGIITDYNVVKLGKGKFKVLGFHNPADGSISMNENYFIGDKMDKVMDSSVASGYHPSRGKKSGVEAVASHEAGHVVTYGLAEKAGQSPEQFASNVVSSVSKRMKSDNATVAGNISKYAKTNAKETIAEAYADVYCNGRKANKVSKAIVREMNKYR